MTAWYLEFSIFAAAGLAEALRFDRAVRGRSVGLTGNALMVMWHAQVMTQTHTVRIYTSATYTPEPLRAEHGAIPSDAPGLGIAWDWDAITRLAEPSLTLDMEAE